MEDKFPDQPQLSQVCTLAVERVLLTSDLPDELPGVKESKEHMSKIAVFVKHYDLKRVLDTYLVLGHSTEERVHADRTLVRIKAVLACHDSIGELPEGFAERPERFHEVKTHARQALDCHRELYTGKAVPLVNEKVGILEPWKLGLAGGHSWKAHIEADCSWADLKSAGESTIDKLDPQKLIDMIRQLHQVFIFLCSLRCLYLSCRNSHKLKTQAYGVLKMRYGAFKQPVVEAISAKVLPLLTEARITLVEHYLFKACLKSNIDVAEAAADVNTQLRSFGQAGIKTTDLQPTLWLTCTKVTGGQAAV